MRAINVGEVYCFLRKLSREQFAETWREASPTLSVTIEVLTRDGIWNAATSACRLSKTLYRVSNENRLPEGSTPLSLPVPTPSHRPA